MDKKIPSFLFRVVMIGVFFALIHGAAFAKYSPMPFWMKAATADVVVAGIIIKVEDNSFNLIVDEWVIGTPEGEDGDIITVEKFKDWTCAVRWEPYGIGQRVMLFLDKQEDGTLKIMGAGGEGEHLITQGQVYVDHRGGGIFGDWQELQVRGKTLTVEPVLLDELGNAVLEFRNCFRVEGEVFSTDFKVRQIVHDKELKKKRFYSDVLDQMVFAVETWMEAKK